MPSPVAAARRLAGRAVLALPDTVAERAFSRVIGYGPGDVPRPIQAPEGAVRLLIAPANYAAQGRRWARAAGRIPGVAAMNLQFTGPNGGFAADASVPAGVVARSRRWSDGQWRAVRGFTHVLVEAERPILGRRFSGDVRREVRSMLDAGISVGFISHGSDLRLPSRHVADSEWSPFGDESWELRETLEAVAAENARIIDEFDLPVFVATPELLADAPGARWLPNLVEPDDWATDAPVLEAARVRVLHAPTNAVIKGSALVEPALERLQAEGLVDYARVEGVPAGEMRDRYAAADVVLDQFRLGIYSTTSIEAMAAGRLVVARLSDDVREHVASVVGEEPPIVQADPDSLEDVLRDIADRRAHYAAIAAAGPSFVRRAHGDEAAAAVLREFLVGGVTGARY
ncbi:hypothetical protein ACFVAJ_01805 [Agromyces sp. NPDC057679]|uniref:glycosyltransferase n=1 Tax=Agromyces sp. NPDC057679 TaxID=3346207 RepID=UPI00366FF28C